MDSRNTLKKNIATSIDNHNLDNKKIVLWGVNGWSRLAIMEFLVLNIFPDAIIDFEPHLYNGKAWGIPIFLPEHYLVPFREDVCLFITSQDYKLHRKFIHNILGLQNGQIYIDYLKPINFHTAKNFLIKFYYLLKNTYLKIYWMIRTKLSHLKHVFLKLIELLRGMQIYQRIIKELGTETYILYANYPGTGDIYLFSLIIDDFLNNIQYKSWGLVVVGGSCKKIAALFDYKNVTTISTDESNALNSFLIFMSDDIKNIKPIIQIANHLDISIRLAGYKLNLMDMYAYKIFNYDSIPKYSFPTKASNSAKIKEIFFELGLTIGKTVIISPYAYSEIGYPPGFWEQLVRRLLSLGYAVATVCHGQERAIKNTVPFDFPFIYATEILELAGYFVGTRSGFCDVTLDAKCKKVILYSTSVHINNSTIYEWASFKNMKLGTNMLEIQWGYHHYKKLVDVIINFISKERQST